MWTFGHIWQARNRLCGSAIGVSSIWRRGRFRKCILVTAACVGRFDDSQTLGGFLFINYFSGEILDVRVRCTLGDIAYATNLRTEGAAFALAECGWLERVRVLARRGDDGDGGVGEEDKMEDGDGLEDLEHSGRTVMTITCEVVEAVARE
ncbi:hypothetical protein BKA82DRAFT_4193835 [Pisolithus tinctorius]|nr:hypothetical protein BKA82DRAFT_4193835 [Pisolithus tinctorius]